MGLLTGDDLAKHPASTWLSLAALGAASGGLWWLDRRSAALGTLAALLGCLCLILPPRERMAALPARLRALPRRMDAMPVLATLLSSPGYGLHWFYGANPYDEAVHLLNGGLAGAVFGALVLADGRVRTRGRLALLGIGFGSALGLGWEGFEWAAGLLGNWTDTWSDVVLTALGATLGTVLVRQGDAAAAA